MTQPGRVAIVGGGISGLTTALTLLAESTTPIDVTVFESNSTTGGLIRATPFAGLDAIDEGADAFLVRVPWAQQLASELGLGATLTSPTSAHAAVWRNGLHSIPQDLLLGVPAKMRAFATSPLISPLGKMRAALEPLLPRTTDEDSIGQYVRRRFGNQVHERLVDPLVGSIYAADTDRFSIAAVPQIASLTASRSLLLAAAKARKTAKKTTQPDAAIFGSPLRGMGALTETLAQRVRALGGKIMTDAPVLALSRHHNEYLVTTAQGEYTVDAIAICSPAQHSASFVAPLNERASQLLSQWDHASVVLITMAISARQWPSHLTGSGYLVPKPEQRWLTAASFGSNKWAHWRPNDGSMIVRVSLGRDGLDVMDRQDDELVNLALADMKLHLGTDFTPHEVRISRWKDSFPQYRPHHFARLAELEHSLSATAPGVVFAGASYRGIGVPACVEQARKGAHALLEHLVHLPK
jgi:protoporphyrinogen/coproporphyrinogen III oxidase